MQFGIPAQVQTPKTVLGMDETPLTDVVRRVYNNYQRAKVYHTRNFDRTVENWKYYWAKNPELGMGQWPGQVVARMLQQNRQLLTYNFVMPTVDRIAGGILQTPFNPDFIPMVGEISSLTQALNSTALIDREVMNWPAVLKDVVVGGLVAEGTMKIVVDRKWSKIGNIGLQLCLPGSVMMDPLWKSPVASDCRKCWEEAWMTPLDIIERWPGSGERIKLAAMRQKLDGDQFGEWTGVLPYNMVSSGSFWGNSYRVILQYEVVDVTVSQDIYYHEDGEYPIPADVGEEEKGAHLESLYGPEWSDRGFVDRAQEKKKVCILTVICPSLTGDCIAHGPTEVQIGCLPHKQWAANRANGENHAIVDALKDPQTNVNYFNSLLVHKLQTEGGGGSQFADPSKFKNRMAYDDYVKNRNNPLKIFELKPGAIDNGVGPVVPTQKSQFPQEAYAQLNHIMQVVWPGVSKTTPAYMGRQESSDISGELYKNMMIQSDMVTFTLNYGFHLFMNDVYEGYYNFFCDLYSRGPDDMPLPREFASRNGKEKVILNEPVTFPDGTTAIRNDVRELKKQRHRVVISEREESPTQKAANVKMYGELLKGMSPEKSGTKNMIWGEIMTNLDQIPPEKKDAFIAMQALETERDVVLLEAQIAKAKAETAQAMAMLNNPMLGAAEQSGTPGQPGQSGQPGLKPIAPPQAGQPIQPISAPQGQEA